MVKRTVRLRGATNDTDDVYPRILPVGDSAVVVEFGSGIDPRLNNLVYSFTDLVESSGNHAVTELIPTYRSVLIHYDPIKKRHYDMVSFLKKLLTHLDGLQSELLVTSELIELPVVYGGADGPDLESVAAFTGLSAQEVVAIHSGVTYRVYMIGFAPGFPYLGGLDERIACPRLDNPRIEVPAGSVGIAGSQTGVYPNSSPGGWQLIGRTAVKLFDATQSNPSLVTPGSQVRFVPVKSHD